MLQAHSALWHYLLIAPNLLLLILAGILWRRGSYKLYPAFFVFAVVAAVAELVSYSADIASSVSALVYWRLFWAVGLVEGLLKVVVLGEIFHDTYHSYPSIAQLGKNLIRGFGVILIFTAALAATFVSNDSRFGIVHGAHLIQQTIYLIETGILVFIFVFSAYFHIRMSHPIFGIALGLAISACVHLAYWSAVSNAGLPNETRYHLEFITMGTYHFVVLLWAYYLLIPQKHAPSPVIVLPDNNLSAWNRELERLLHQ